MSENYARHRPSTDPVFYVLVQAEGAGTPERVDTSDLVLSLEYEDSEKKTDQLKLTVDNWDLSNFDTPIWKKGNKVFVTWGYPGQMAPQRMCVIQKVEGSTTLTVTAQGGAVLMNKDEKSKTYENTPRSEIVHALAKEYGYGDDQRFIEDTEEVYETVVQARATDAQFIKRLADAEGFEFFIDFDGFHWHSRKMGQKPLRLLQYYLPPDVGDILSFNVENDVFAKPGRVTTKGRDPVKKQDVTGEADNGKTERDALNPTVEIIDPATGVATFDTAVASTSTQPTTETSAAQAKKEADGKYKRSVQTTVKLSLEMVGDPGIVAKSVLDIRGISKRLSGLYYVSQANHKIDSGGYKLSLKLQTDGTNGHSQNLLDEGKKKGAGGGSSKSGAITPEMVRDCEEQLQRYLDVARDKVALLGKDHPDAKRAQEEAYVMKQRCTAMREALGKATPNSNKGDAVDAGASTMTTVIDPATGLETYQYSNTQGREKP